MPTIVKAIIEQRSGKIRKKFYNGGKPLLRVTQAMKIADDFEHTKNVIDFYIESSWYQDQTTINSGNYRDLYILYDAYNMLLPEEYFHYVTNPMNSSKKEHVAYPSRIRPYSIIRPNMDLLMGEWEKRPKNYIVEVKNEDAVNVMQEQINKVVLGALEQMFVNSMNEEGVETGMESQEVEPPAKIKAAAQTTYQDKRAIMGQAMSEKLYEELNIREEENRLFKDWLIAGEVYSEKDVINGDMYYTRLSPLDIDYDKSPDVQFVEDGSWATRRIYMTPSDIVSRWWDQLYPGDIDDLEEQDSTLPFTATYFNTLFGNTYRTEEDLRRSKIPVYTVYWKYYKKIGFVSYEDEMGENQEFMVPEGYKKTKEEKVEWFWIPQVWKGRRIDVPYLDPSNTASGASGGKRAAIYFDMGPMVAQRGMMNNVGHNKLPINGMRFSDTHSRNISMVELGLPYEILYIILHYRLELTIARNKGKIALIDRNVIPDDDDWDEEKFFYYAESMGFGLIDRNQKGVDKSYNQYQVLDMDLLQHIKNLIDIMQFIKEEWDQLAGITPQRKGQVMATETATGVNAARYQSSVISERTFTRFEEFLRRERAGRLDLSKFVNLDNYKSIWFSNDTRRELINIAPQDYMETEFGIYQSSAAEDIENLALLKQMLPNMAPNMDAGSVMELIQGRNVSKLKQIMAEKEQEEIERAQQQQQSEQEAQQQIEQIKGRYMEMQKEMDEQLIHTEYDRKERIEHIKGQYGLADTNTPGDQLDPLALQDQVLKTDELTLKDKNENRKMDIEEKKIDKDFEGKKIQAETALKVAKENKNQFDTPKKKTAK